MIRCPALPKHRARIMLKAKMTKILKDKDGRACVGGNIRVGFGVYFCEEISAVARAKLSGEMGCLF